LLRFNAVRVLLVSANRETLPSPVVPLGVLSVAGAARARHEVAVLDLCFVPDPELALREKIAEVKPDVVGLGLRNLHDNAYASSEPLLDYYERVAKEIRASSDAPLVVGGAAVTLQPQGLIERLGAAHAIVGEGERAFCNLLERLERGEQPDKVLALSSSPAVVSLRRRDQAFDRDLDDLPAPARDLVDPRYFDVDGTDAVQTKRGCAFSCTYCDYPDLEGKKVRTRSPERVADEIAARAAFPGVSHVFIVDSVFNVPRSHALAVCRALIERKVRVPWVAYVTPASLDEELVRTMAEAGCVGVEIGTDAGTARMLERLKKPFTLEQVRRAHDAFVRHGIAESHTFVLGAEDETALEARKTLEFVDELDPDVAVFVVFMEDREHLSIGRARHRDALLELLAREARTRPRWIVPELGIRFGDRIARVLRRRGVRGPSWLELARRRGTH
jgi:hypothetical protein